jgi:hypothetical protein
MDQLSMIRADMPTKTKSGKDHTMDSAVSYSKMLTAIEQTIDDLLAEGETRDALILMSSESIIRHHLGPRLSSKISVLMDDETIACPTR